MVAKTTRTVKVPESTSEEWEEYAEENPEVDSISHLIRLSVAKEMGGKYDIGRRRQSGESDVREGVSGEILTTLRSIETAIGDIEERLETLEEVESAEANYDLQRAIFSQLPTKPELAKSGTLERHEWAPTAEEIAQKLGAEETDVEEALEQLAETTGQVRHDGTHYWRKEE